MPDFTTFSVLFFTRKLNRNKTELSIYAPITVDGKRAEISLKRSISVTYWDTRFKRVNSRTAEGKALNVYLDQVYPDLLECHKQLIGESIYDHTNHKSPLSGRR